MHIHLDPIGGIAGDMFIAALLDAFPDLADGLSRCIDRLDLGPLAFCRLERHRDHALQGARFLVDGLATDGHAHGRHPEHAHTSWKDIRKLIAQSSLDDAVKKHAIAIFELLAHAESQVHGIPEDEVSFHEVGATDSIVDIIGAAYLISELRAARWSVAPLPLGSGWVHSAHGRLPVPAPATVLLLQGYAVHDDGVRGERVTPTGAAIVRYLGCVQQAYARPRVLARTGIGFGAKAYLEISNCLRVLVFDETESEPQHRELAVIEFEVDDQSAEDLAIGLERLRAMPAIFDVLQMPAFGKKGRMMTHVQVLTRPAELAQAIDACFQETTTIGLRYRTVGGAALRRQVERVKVDGRQVRVKTVERPQVGCTTKAEADDIADADGGQAGRARLRMAAEHRVFRSETMGAEAADLPQEKPAIAGSS